uniref:INO80 complex subunit C n=1 Tax=Callorhinchus milii TaxID=7868 RepID=A0A4W3JHM7_CALMI
IGVLDTIGESKTLATDSSPGHGEPAAKPPVFKDPNFIHSGIGGASVGKKSRVWKNLKQILAAERTLPWKLNDPNCELFHNLLPFSFFCIPQ